MSAISLFILIYPSYAAYTPLFRLGSGASSSEPWSEQEPKGVVASNGRAAPPGSKRMTFLPHVPLQEPPLQGLPVQVPAVAESEEIRLGRAAVSNLKKVNPNSTEFAVLPPIRSLRTADGRQLTEAAVQPVTVETDGSQLAEAVSTQHISPDYTVEADGSRLAEAASTPTKTLITSHIHTLTIMLLGVTLVMIVGHMVGPSPGEGGQVSYRVPPQWSPERESSGYSFKSYITDLTLWIMLTDLAPHQQAAAIIMRLGGAARDMARTITPQELINGGAVNGVQLDPVSYVIHGLHTRFAQLGEESRLVAMTEMLSFQRRPNEGINEVLTRYEVVRQRARNEGQFVMTTEGCALQLLRACGVTTQQFFYLLQPFGNRLPTTEQEFGQMQGNLRRMGHILERTPGNIASALHGGGSRMIRGHHYADAFMATHSAATDEFGQSQGWGEHQPHQDAWRDTGDQGDLWRNLSPEASWPNGGGQTAGYEDHSWTPTGGSYVATTGQGWMPTGGSLAPTYSSDNWWPNTAPDTQGTQNTFWQGVPELDDSGTDTDTSSDSGQEELDMSDLRGMTDAEASEYIYWQYRTAKRRWRRVAQRPVRKFRRYAKRFRRKGKGKGSKGFGFGKSGRPHFLAQNDEVLAYLKGSGKGKRSHTSGKGFGRRKNPRGRDGQIMKCRVCNSEEHFAARCPQRNSSGATGSGTPHLFTDAESAGPLSGMLDSVAHTHAEPPSRENTLHFMVLREEDRLQARDPWRTYQQGSPHGATSSMAAQRSTGSSSSGWRSAGSYQATRERPQAWRNTMSQQQPDAPQPQQAPAAVSPNLTTDQQLQSILLGTAIAHQARRDLTQQRSGPRRNEGQFPTIPASIQTIMTLEHTMLASASAQGQAVAAPADQSPMAWSSGFQGLFTSSALRAGLAAAAVPVPTAADGRQLAEAAATAQAGDGGQLAEAPAARSTPDDPPIPTIYDGDNRTCTICIQEFGAGQRVIRLTCRHVFHGDCWTRLMMSEPSATSIECPNCRGPGHLIAMWNYIDPLELTQPGAPNLLYMADTHPNAMPSGYGTPNSTATAADAPGSPSVDQVPTYTGDLGSTGTSQALRPPWLNWVVLPSTWQDAEEWVPATSAGSNAQSYHVETRLPGNRPALIIDPGSVGNLGGDEWAKSVARAAQQAGMQPREYRRQRPLEVKGVGNGSQSCTHNCVLPIAMQQANGQTRVGTFEAPIVGGSTLPGLLGLQSLCRARAVLDLVNMQLHLLGPGDWRQDLPPGTETYQLEQAPSGHLALPCSDFNQRQVGLSTNSRQITLAATLDGSQLAEANVAAATSDGCQLAEADVTAQAPQSSL